MLEAWKSADRALPLKVVGQGQLAELVINVASSCKQVEYLGAKSLDEVFDLMRRAEFLIFPSEWYETMGRTIMEAFAVGTPVVASRIGPPSSMVVAGETGFHFAPANVAELREKVEWCSANLDRVRGLRAAARRAFETSYTGAANMELLLRVYQKAQVRPLAKANQELGG